MPALFDRLADRFDQVIPFFAGFAGQLLGALGPPAGTRLLDAGCGRGAIAVAAAERGCAVTAVDAAPRMVELLRADHPGLDVRHADLHRLDLPDASFDLVTGGFVIHLAADPARVAAELLRVLRPGGTVALTVPGPYTGSNRWAAWNELAETFRNQVAWPKREIDVAAALRAAGFVEARVERFEVHLPVADPQTCWAFHMSHGFAGMVETLDPADAAEFHRLALAELTRMHEAGGIVVDAGAVAHIARRP